jgi:hypothetical protein
MRKTRMPLIPPLVLWTIGALGAAALVKLLAREHHRVNAELERARSTPVGRRGRPTRTLRRDPGTGVYHPQD